LCTLPSSFALNSIAKVDIQATAMATYLELFKSKLDRKIEEDGSVQKKPTASYNWKYWRHENAQA